MASLPSAGPRGFTLLEMMVGAVTTAIIMAAVAAAFIGVQGAYQAESQIKTSVEGLRTSTAFLERRLRMAGYGIDPRFAFDFDAKLLPEQKKSNYSIALGTRPPALTDDLAIRYRDPAWLRRGRYASGTLTLETGQKFGMDFRGGQRFLVSCIGGEYLVVKAGPAGVGRDATAASQLAVDEAKSMLTASATCLQQQGHRAPYVMLLHELRVRVREIEGRPFLVAYQGLEELSDTNYVPLAADVESFQVAYVMNRPRQDSPLVNTAQPVDKGSDPANWVLGDVGSADTDRIPDVAAKPEPRYDTPYESDARYNRHPANIRAVRVTLGVRSARREPNGRKGFYRVSLEDSVEAANPDGFYRSNLSIVVRLPNMLSRSSFNPPLGDASTALNVWGG
jgi:type IV pilus assembly protein PilW